MIYTTNFSPNGFLQNRHVQTVIASWFVAVPSVNYIRERIPTADHDFFDVDWLMPAVSNDETPLVVLQHGLEGSSSSPYIKRLGCYFVAQGYKVAAVNFRSCSGDVNNRAYSYHAGFYYDLKQLIEREHGKRPGTNISLVGISLGGCTALAAAENIEHKLLHKIALISVPFDLAAGLEKIEQGSNRIYNTYFTSQLKRSYIRKYQKSSSISDLPLSITELKKIEDLRSFDHRVTAAVSGYSSGAEYYRLNRPLDRLKRLRACSDKIGIFASADDPLIHESAFSELSLLCETNYHFWQTQKGGHVGFIDWRVGSPSRQWIIEQVFDWIDGRLP